MHNIAWMEQGKQRELIVDGMEHWILQRLVYHIFSFVPMRVAKIVVVDGAIRRAIVTIKERERERRERLLFFVFLWSAWGTKRIIRSILMAYVLVEG